MYYIYCIQEEETFQDIRPNYRLTRIQQDIFERLVAAADKITDKITDQITDKVTDQITNKVIDKVTDQITDQIIRRNKKTDQKNKETDQITQRNKETAQDQQILSQNLPEKDPVLEKIDQLYLKLYIILLNYKLGNNKYKNIIISRLAVLGFCNNSR